MTIHPKFLFPNLTKKMEEDRISSLPDCLILEILSRLHSIKQAIRTGSLSKRWKHLWPLLPNLIFDNNIGDFGKELDFFSLVDKTLTQCCHLNLNSFQLYTMYLSQFKSQVKNWICFAISRNVQELILSFQPRRTGFVLDEFFFTYAGFSKLELEGCMFNPTGVIRWNKLKSLHIGHAKLDDKLIENIISGSPLLETLELYRCHGFTRLHNTSKSVKNLVFYGYGFPHHMFVLDEFFFTYEGFIKLVLHGCMFNPTSVIRWNKLKSLYVSHAELDDKLIQNIISGSPILETLQLSRCHGFRRLHITSKCLKNLVFSGYGHPYHTFNHRMAYIVEISAPHILSLTIQDGLNLMKLSLLNVSSLVNAYLNYYNCFYYETMEQEEEMLKGLITNLFHAKKLNVRRLCLEVLDRLEAKGFIFPSNMKRLQW